ncbi:TonB-dependent receptor [Chitinophaga barathri]|uniref:TonB-dependent receptor n=1 Tax=Chitinophaga barathri TaxID=1647451 RepID=A0A3N4M4Y2_9BACT|nr:TonB-dependent receptor [Chitinophaga barathri]RPD38221.1 TonB-dependent receptor [Chitinophaga barathri]
MPRTAVRIFLFVYAWLFAQQAYAQQGYTVSGYVRDSTTGESLIGASIGIKGTTRGVQTNTYGFFAVTLPPGEHTLVFTFIGYQPQERPVKAGADRNVTALLVPRSFQAKEVVITDRRKDENIKNTDMGKVELSTEQMKKLPALMGEVDPLKILQLLPGVQAAGEGNAGFYVRGGGPDQNLILLDEAPVYNTGHLFGFFSIFNADAIKNVTLIKGGMPANYGGRLSSVVDVTMKDGNNQQWQAEGGIGAIASRLNIQGPLQKDKSSFMISARRTYADLLAKPFVRKSSSFYGSGYYFYDLNAKANYQFSAKDRIFLSGYLGRDVFRFRNGDRSFEAHIPWGNNTATLRWNHVFNKKLFANTSLIYNDYKFSFGAINEGFTIQLNSGIKDYNGKLDFDYFLNLKHHIKFGGNYIYHTFTPSSVSGRQDTTVFQPDNAARKYAHEAALYIQDDWEISPRLKANIGLRYSGFRQIGPYTRYTRNQDGNKLDSTVYGRGQEVRSYGGLEPRLLLRYAWNDRESVKASVTRNNQYIHLVTNAGSTLPTDIWVPSTYLVKPQFSWQYSAGYFRNFANNSWEASLEAYYKDMRNQVEYREGYTPSLKDPEEEFVYGKGYAYGAELFIHKIKGKLTGWIGYTLAWTWRQFPALNGGKRFPAKYDRRHDLAVVASYEHSPRWTFSGVFIFGSGNTTTLPEKFYFLDGVLTQEYGDLNSYRMKPYHRLDLSAVYTPKKKNPNRRLTSSWAFSIYNTYSRMNPYFIYFDQTGNVLDGSLEIKAKQVSLFPIIPSITWNFKF